MVETVTRLAQAQSLFLSQLCQPLVARVVELRLLMAAVIDEAVPEAVAPGEMALRGMAVIIAGKVPAVEIAAREMALRQAIEAAVAADVSRAHTMTKPVPVAAAPVDLLFVVMLEYAVAVLPCVAGERGPRQGQAGHERQQRKRLEQGFHL